MMCQELVRGDYRSPNGTNRYSDCEHAARFVVTANRITPPMRPRAVCGVHVRRYRRTNEQMWQTDDVLKRDRRPAFYVIEEVAA